MSLPLHEEVDLLDGICRMHAQPQDRLVVTDVAVRGRLAHAHVLVVLCLRDGHRLVEAAQVAVERRQSIVVFGFKPPDQDPLQTIYPL